jgi:RNA polymerase sigma-70 factor (ECF subfamily)
MLTSDEELMERCSNGDMAAFELIVLRYKDAIFNFVFHFLTDYHRAQDISQETFLSVLRNSGRYRSSDRFKTWLYKIAANLCKNELRYKKRHKTLSLEDSILEIESLSFYNYTSPDENYERDEITKLVKEAVSSLPEDQRMAIIMREYQDLSYEEISSVLNCSLGAVKSKIHRARQSIKKIFIASEVS